jgi:hypothetical protein
VNHASLDSRKKQWLCVRIWPASPDRRINVLGSKKLLPRLQKDEEVDVGEAMLLELNCIDISNHPPKNAVLVNVLDDCFLFELENASHQIGSISRLLTRKQLASDFRPVGICCSSNEKVDSTIIAGNRH